MGKRGTGLQLHYGWIILMVSTLTVMGSLGFARFGYTVILPEMQAALDLSNVQTGALATGTSVGYLFLAAIGGALATRYGARRLVSISLLLVGGSMILTGAAEGFGQALAWRTLTGMGSGGSYVPAVALLSSWFAPRRRGLAAGLAVTGTSLGLVITGHMIPRILAAAGPAGWRQSWYTFGGAVLATGLLAFWVLRESPAERGVGPIGALPGEPELSPPKGQRPRWSQVYGAKAIWHLGLVYVAFGLSYVIYTTFFVKHLQAEGGYTPESAGNLWALVGWLSLFCGVIAGGLSDLLGRRFGLGLVYSAQAASYVLFAVGSAPAAYMASAILFGLVAWSIPGIIAAACGDYVGAKLAPAALGFLTLFFGLGQAIGPSLAGAIADATGSFRLAFVVAAVVALAGGAGSLLLREPSLEERSVA